MQEERALAGTQLQALERKGEALDAELAQYADNDPERIELMRKLHPFAVFPQAAPLCWHMS